MLEEAFPALWSAVHGFFTPAVLFIVLNIVIGTIAVTSKAAVPAAAEGEAADAAADSAAGGSGGGEGKRNLSRVPSMTFDRLRSFNLSRFAAPAPQPAVAGVTDLGYEQLPAAEAAEKEEEEAAVEAEAERELEHAHAAHMERSRSEAAAELEVPRLPARLHKSASENSAFAHFEVEEVEEAVEARRPATTRDGGAAAARRGRRLPVPDSDSDSDSEAEPEEDISAGVGGEVDARADDFINKFRHQLKLQRMDSILRYRETIRRGQAAAVAGGM